MAPAPPPPPKPNPAAPPQSPNLPPPPSTEARLPARPGFEASLIEMVKIEECDEDGAVSAGARVLRNDVVDPQPDPTHASVKLEEEGQPCSSSNNLRSHFIGMGFAPKMVDKMLQKHGDHDSNVILESLLSHSAPQNSGSESSSSLDSFFDSDNEETGSPLLSRREDNQNIKPELDSFLEKRSYLLGPMNFSPEEVDLAFNQLGEEAPLDQLVDCIVTAQGAGFSGDKDNGHATNEGMVESLYGEMDKIVSLLRMGFTEEEVSSAIDNFGQEAPVQELADSIFARRIASTIEQNQVKIESEFLGETETDYPTSHQRLSYYDDDDDDKKRVKKAKHVLGDDRGASTSRVVRQPSLTPWSSGRFGSYSDGSMKEEVHEVGSRANIRGDLAKPPYFLYGNVIDITKDTWHKLSGFMFSVQPEIVNTQLFSALARKEGYIHNLPTERRRIPKSPVTIEEALPFTKQFWPSWDKRKKISGVTLEVAGAEKICGELGRMIRDSRGLPSEEKQVRIMDRCKMANLIWTGQGRLSPLQPDQLERILGYPSNHTGLPGLNPQDRIAAMTYAFQTATLAHILSVLKDMYPDGLRVLSIYSGVGGAEVALHRLGIRLKCVVSVEESDVNRKILKRWWGRTEQAGELKQLDSINKLKTDLLEDLIDKFGGFDLVVGGTYNSCRGGTTVSATMGMDSGQFHEYVRVVQSLRSMHGLN